MPFFVLTGFGVLCLFSLSPQASPDWPFLVFGSTIGVVVGSVSVRDARPACIPEGSLRGPVLPMEAQGGDDGEIASERVRFKVHTAGFVTAEIVFFNCCFVTAGFGAVCGVGRFLKTLDCCCCSAS